MNTIGDRLKYARETAPGRLGRDYMVTQGELGKVMEGITQTAVFKMEQNKNKRGEVGVTKLMKAAEFLKVSFLWLATGKGTMDGSDEELLSPFYGDGGLPVYLPQHIRKRLDDNIHSRLTITDKLQSRVTDKAFFTVCTDDGLAPMITTGGLVLVDPGSQMVLTDYVLTNIKDSPFPVVRQIVANPEGGYLLKPLNPNYPSMPLEELADLVGVVLEFRTWPDANLSFKDLIPDNRHVIKPNVVPFNL
ncbi:hypothetical protein GCM10023116_46520 [Kistimonas scapharcae]|uniref:HTH cro/C1-type domain-containing protein n=1 Tax=Kistimonas scapharcae TaxID=1036133 RepID=A0ABP8V7Z7_9GAMM